MAANRLSIRKYITSKVVKKYMKNSMTSIFTSAFLSSATVERVRKNEKIIRSDINVSLV